MIIKNKGIFRKKSCLCCLLAKLNNVSVQRTAVTVRYTAAVQYTAAAAAVQCNGSPAAAWFSSSGNGP